MFFEYKKIIRRILKKKKKHIFINKDSELKLCYEYLSERKTLGVDTEFDWRTTYKPKLSLIQIATTDRLYIIDCLKLNPHEFLRYFFESNSFLKILHAARSDATVISSCLNIKLKNVFDIQVAEKIINEEQIKSYGKLVYKYFGVNLEKQETNSNWLRRPLSQSQLNYAFEDIDFLIHIFKFQTKILKKNNLLKDAYKLSKNEVLKGNKKLMDSRIEKNPRLKKKEKSIFIWREETAEKENIPPNFVFKSKYLSKLAKLKTDDPLIKKKLISILGSSSYAEKFIKEVL